MRSERLSSYGSLLFHSSFAADKPVPVCDLIRGRKSDPCEMNCVQAGHARASLARQQERGVPDNLLSRSLMGFLPNAHSCMK